MLVKGILRVKDGQHILNVLMVNDIIPVPSASTFSLLSKILRMQILSTYSIWISGITHQDPNTISF